MSRTPEPASLGPAEALYAFMGYLMTREQALTISRNHQCMNEVAHLIGEYCRVQGWAIRDERWFEKIKAVLP